MCWKFIKNVYQLTAKMQLFSKHSIWRLTAEETVPYSQCSQFLLPFQDKWDPNNSELATLSKDIQQDIGYQRTYDKMMRYWVLNIRLIKKSMHALQLAVSQNAHTAEWRFEIGCFSRSHSHKAAIQTFTFEIRYSANSTWSNNVALLGKECQR